MEKISPCRCGAVPYFTPYYQSIDGNHDTPASVMCPICGRSTVMDWNLWREVEEEVGDEKYERPTAYLSQRFMDALNDATIRKWNRENGGVMAEKGTMTATLEQTLDMWKLLAGEPTEHIVVNPTVLEVKFKDGKARRYPQDIRERIVRCRDCKYAMEHRSKSILGTELVTLTCSGPIQGAYSEEADVEPEGFCAWGEPREEA